MSRTRVPDLGSRVKLTVSGMSVNGTTVSPWARPGRVHSGNPIAAKLAAVSPVFNTSRRVIVLAMIVPLDCMKLVPAVLPSSIRGDQRGSAPKRTGAIADLNFTIITGIQKLLCKLAGIFVCIRGCILCSFLCVFVVKEGPNPPRRREESRRLFDQVWNSWPRFFGVDATWALQGAVQRSQTACPA